MEKCPKCGYEEPIEEEETMSITQKIVYGFLIGLLALALIFTFDRAVFDGRYFNHIYYSDACDYQMPKEWEIVNNGEFYAVRKTDKSGLYLYEGRFGPNDMYITISKPALFLTECKAKAYMKAYMKKYHEPKMKF